MQLQLLLLSIATQTTIAQRLVEAGSLVRENLFKRFSFVKKMVDQALCKGLRANL